MTFGVLIVEDEAILAKNMRRYLERQDYDVQVASSGEEGLEAFERFQPDLVLLDYRLPGMDGLEVLEKLRAKYGDVRAILITAHGNVEIAVEAMKAGAADYLSKPVALDELRLVIERTIGHRKLEDTLSYYRQRDADKSGLSTIIGKSAAVRDLKRQIGQLLISERALKGETPPCVLIAGETGTGKDLLARAIHFEGPRADRPFIEVNCTSIPALLIESELFGHERGAFTDAREAKPGLVETANGGTLFLDEIGDIEPAMQVKLLKLIEDKVIRRVGSLRDRRVDVRILAATNRPLEAMVANGQFRSDLYFRLRVMNFELPPLRERGKDVIDLASHFVELHGRRYNKSALHLSQDAEAKIVKHGWPGNIRELRNVIEQVVLMAENDVIQGSQLPLSSSLGNNNHAIPSQEPTNGAAFSLPTDGIDLEKLEGTLVLQALERSGWNVSRAAKLLRITRDTLRYRIEKFGLKDTNQR